MGDIDLVALRERHENWATAAYPTSNEVRSAHRAGLVDGFGAAAELVEEARRERDEATRRLAVAHADIERLESEDHRMGRINELAAESDNLRTQLAAAQAALEAVTRELETVRATQAVLAAHINEPKEPTDG